MSNVRTIITIVLFWLVILVLIFTFGNSVDAFELNTEWLDESVVPFYRAQGAFRSCAYVTSLQYFEATEGAAMTEEVQLAIIEFCGTVVENLIDNRTLYIDEFFGENLVLDLPELLAPRIEVIP